MGKIIIANWKMQLSTSDSLLLAKKLKSKARNFAHSLVICPDYLALSSVAKLIKSSPILLGAQDCASLNRGTLTGEISPLDLKNLGVKYVIIGHSERRTKLGESDQLINEKIKAALALKLIPVICLGESLEIKESGQTRKFLMSELKSALRTVEISSASSLIIAYEPLWAIGTGHAIIPAEAELMAAFLEAEAAKILKKKVRVVYGGSVDVDNAAEFLKQKHIAGLLVGGASLKANFSSIC
jgi:triosephosphate isomerase